VTCYFCHKKRHIKPIRHECAKSRATGESVSNQRAGNGPNCYLCGAVGHKKYNCPRKGEGQSAGQSVGIARIDVTSADFERKNSK